MTQTKCYWFPAKRYGWGWGVPTFWQGWVVYLVYLSLLGHGIFFLIPSNRVAAFLGITMVSTLVLLMICWVKGEPPSWRWGKE